MSPWSVSAIPLRHPQKTLIVVFVAWKCLLLVLAASSPGPGYDTSTTLAQPYEETPVRNHVAPILRLLSTKLTRWDAIYFTGIASRDYLYEQDWAFGWGFTRLIKFFIKELKEIDFQDHEFLGSFVGICLAHVAHCLSVLVLYSLAWAVFPTGQSKNFAFITACLHIFSPAGIFLSAPYGESIFAFLSFSGYLLFSKSFNFGGQSSTHQDILIAISGLLLGSATTVRSNGLLNGLLFLEEAIITIYSWKNGPVFPVLRRLTATGVGGVCVAMGFLFPQFIAFREFCWNQSFDNQLPRIWCSDRFPSIYGFVQSHYWNVGFLRYWTLSNLPLFALAFPMLTIMTTSSYWAIQGSNGNDRSASSSTTAPLKGFEGRLLRSLAIPQLCLAILALTSYHVQIITRISSGYCIWYFWLAHAVTFSSEECRRPKVDKSIGWRVIGSKETIMYIVIYAAVQAGLFSSFLPPA